MLDDREAKTLSECLRNNLVSDHIADAVWDSLERHGYRIVAADRRR